MRFLILAVLLLQMPTTNAGEHRAIPAVRVRYAADWKSLDARPTPRWWRDAKFGIFVHWGLYSVPAFAPTVKQGEAGFYAEHYQHRLLDGEPVFTAYHHKFHGGRPYSDFAADFAADHFDARVWADLFRRAGAKYAVLTAKHHDGYALWPSRSSRGYDSVSTGPKRDICREFADAMRAVGLKRGFYHSLLEYDNPLYGYGPHSNTVDLVRFTAEVNHVQLKELADWYEADIIWPDGEWQHSDREFRSEEYLAWLFNDSKVRDTVVVNDRWGRIHKDGVPVAKMMRTRGRHGGHYTTEYGRGAGDAEGVGSKVDPTSVHPWEECRGIGRSFGYNRFERTEDYLSAADLVELLVGIVANGGNLLLNVGPDRHGLIPPIMEERLLQMGRWLQVNGEAIYASRPWRDAPSAAEMKETHRYFTGKDGYVYAILAKWPTTPFEIKGLKDVRSVSLLGYCGKVKWRMAPTGIVIDPSSIGAGELPCEWAWTFRIEQGDSRTQLFVNEDPWHFWVADSGEVETMRREGATPMKSGIDSTQKGLKTYIDEIARGRVTHFLMCVNGQRANFPSEVLEPVWVSLEEPERRHEAWTRTLKRLADEGLDPYRVWIDRCREKGITPWISIRMNDLHHWNDPGCPNISTLWRKHPELQIDPKGRWNNGFDYSRPEVRVRMLAFVKEVLDRYDADGIEMDLIRFRNYLPKEREAELAPVFTDFIRDIRRAIDASAVRRGHPISLSARVMAYPENSRERGLQVDVWVREGLVDFVMPCNFFGNIRSDISVDDWRAWIGDCATIVPGADSGVTENGVRRLATLPEYRKWAAEMRKRGATGFYLYNLFGHPQDGEVWNGILSDGLDAEVSGGVR